MRNQIAAKPPIADTAFKNVRVLKGIPVDEFMGTMGLSSAALSVCCGDCHTGAGTDNPKWEDDKPQRKVIARQMVTMVDAINKANFSGPPGGDLLDVSSRQSNARRDAWNRYDL